MNILISRRTKERLTSFVLFLILLMSTGCQLLSPRNEMRPQTLHVVFSGRLLSLDPHLQHEHTTWNVLGNLYDGLVAPDADWKIGPALAASWSTPSPTCWQFTLRSGVRFHGGKVLTPADVVYSIDRARIYRRSAFNSLLDCVRSVRAMEGNRVEVVTRYPTPLLLYKLQFVMIVPRGDSFERPDLAGHPVGTGPFRFSCWSGEEELLLSRFPECWRPSGFFPSVSVRFVADPGRWRAVLQSSEADVVWGFSPTDLGIHHRSGLPWVVSTYTDQTVYYLLAFPGTGRSHPLSDPRIREALALSLNRDTVQGRFPFGRFTPLSTLVPGAINGSARLPAFPGPDHGKAARLLAEAGIRGTVQLDLGFNQMAAPLAEALRKQLEADSPFRLGMKSIPSGTFYRVQDTRDFSGIMLVGFRCGSGDIGDLLDTFLQSRESRADGEDLRQEPARVMDSLIERAEKEDNPLFREQILGKLSEEAARQGLVIPLALKHAYRAASPVLYLPPRQDGRIHFDEIRPLAP